MEGSFNNRAIGKNLSITLQFSKGFELANFKAVTRIVRKEPYRKEDWKGNQYWGISVWIRIYSDFRGGSLEAEPASRWAI
jgi:hypothetical protein